MLNSLSVGFRKERSLKNKKKFVVTITSLDPHISEGNYDTVYDVIEIYIDGQGNCLRVSEVEDFDVNRNKN